VSEHAKLFSVTSEQVIDAVIRSASVKAVAPGVILWTENAAEQIEAALSQFENEQSGQNCNWPQCDCSEIDGDQVCKMRPRKS